MVILDELLPAPEGQFVIEARDEAVGNIEGAVTLVPLLVLGGDRGELVGRAEVQTLLPRVGAKQVETLAKRRSTLAVRAL